MTTHDCADCGHRVLTEWEDDQHAPLGLLDEGDTTLER
jgi:hypothetical protein